MMNRANLFLSGEDDAYTLTLMKPASSEYNGKLIVIYEDAFGDVNLNIMTPQAIFKNYGVDIELINNFI